MSKIKGSGRPTRKTVGGVGDIYMDVSTGKRYKCIAAYGVSGDYDYQWKPMTNPFGKAEETKEEVKPVQKEVSKPAPVEVKEVTEEKVETVEEVKAEPKKSEKKQKKAEKPAESAVEANSKKVDYAAAYKSK